jgi:hypothetical protein
MKAGIRPGVRGALVAMCVTVVLAGATNPDTANAAGYLIQSKEDPRLCLSDSEPDGIKLRSCDSFAARWEIWNRGWTRSFLTGRCLRATTRLILGGGCSESDKFAFWQHWNGGWYQRMGSSAAGPPMCLSRLPGYPTAVTIRACVNPTGWHHPRELWYVRAA